MEVICRFMNNFRKTGHYVCYVRKFVFGILCPADAVLRERSPPLPVLVRRPRPYFLNETGYVTETDGPESMYLHVQ